jgi:hypothetical protein
MRVAEEGKKFRRGRSPVKVFRAMTRRTGERKFENGRMGYLKMEITKS